MFTQLWAIPFESNEKSLLEDDTTSATALLHTKNKTSLMRKHGIPLHLLRLFFISK